MALVQLVLGPLLATACAYFLLPTTPAENAPLSFASVYFFAGLAPRTVIDWISSTVRRVYLEEPKSSSQRRTLPLSNLRGITPTIESRLAEEGIETVDALSMANPVKLLRDTPYDPRQVLGWIDEAILIITLPDHWLKLEALGISGAIDLAWYALDDEPEQPSQQPLTSLGPPPAPQPSAPANSEAPPVPDFSMPITSADGASDIPPEIKNIAQKIGLDERFLLDVVTRLLYDDQLELVWAMYESNG